MVRWEQTIERTVEVTEWTDTEGDTQQELLTDKVPQRFFTSQVPSLLYLLYLPTVLCLQWELLKRMSAGVNQNGRLFKLFT